MAKSLNGWSVITSWSSPRLRAIKIPGTRRSVRLHRAVAPVFAAFLADWQAEMPDRMNLNPGPTDGWNYRKSRYVNNYSNHASGTAVDVLYSSVLPADGKPHMTKEEKRILDGILDRYKTSDGHRIFANGEWWNKADGMHTELSQKWDRGAKRNTTLKDVQEVRKLLGITRNGKRTRGPQGSLWDNVVPRFENVKKAESEKIASIAAYRISARLYDLGYYKGKPPVKYDQKYPYRAVRNFNRKNGIAGSCYTKETEKKLFG